MKEFLNNNLGKLGLAFYYPMALFLRIPVFLFLAIVIVSILLIWGPITGKDVQSTKWITRLYDWYCGD